MNERHKQLEMLIDALKGAAMGISAAVEDESITSQQVYALLFSLIAQIESLQME